jgi:2-phospho-L-lactate guanylyltransferase
LHGGKSRLAPVLDPGQRSSLIASLARHVVRVVLESGISSDVVLVSREHELGTRLGFEAGQVFSVHQPDALPGMNAAIDIGRAHALKRGSERLLVLSGDLPQLSGMDLVAIGAAGADVVVGTDRLRRGTNALMLRGDRALREFHFEFGIDSRIMHRSEASRHGLSRMELSIPGIELDLDTPDDWAMLSRDTRQRLLSQIPEPRPPFVGAAETDSMAVLEHA